MKQIVIIIISFLTIGGFFSCEKEEGPVVTTESSIALDSVGDYISVLTPEKSDSVFTVLTWTAAEYNVDVLQSFRVEVDTAGNNFNDAVTVLNTDKDTAAITVFQLNKALTGDLGLAPNTECSIEIRIGSVLGEKDPRTYSEFAEFTVTTYDPPFEPEEVFVHGQDSILGSLFPVMDDDDVISGLYEGYVYVSQSGDEILLGDQAGDIVFGDDNQNGPDTDLELNDPIAENAAAIPVDSGYYKVIINTYDLNYDMYETTWAMIGKFNSWDGENDHDMTYNEDKGVWTTTIDLPSGAFKFRANDDWFFNYGDNEADGTLEQNGTDIVVDEAGNYDVTLDLSGYPYTYSLSKN